MPESVIGAKTTDILHQVKTKEGSLTVTHNSRDIVANTIGHVLAIPTTHTILWTWSSAFKNPSPELADQLFERYKDVPWKGDVLVRVGHTSIIGEVQRFMARNDNVRGRPWMLKDPVGRVFEKFGKAGLSVLYLMDGMFTLGQAVWSKVFRTDFYNPFTNTVNIYHPKLAVGMHELGHAEFFNNQVTPTGRLGIILGRLKNVMINGVVPFHLPLVTPYIEYQASKNAMTHYKTDKERREGLKILEGAWATYVFDDVVNFAFIPEPINSVFRLALSYPASVAGHLMARLYPKQDQRFGYIFSGKDQGTSPKKQELSAHQVLVATAKAPKAGHALVEGKGGRQFSEEPLKNGKRPQHSNTSRITF